MQLQGDGSTEMHLVDIVLTGRHKDKCQDLANAYW